ncbi:MAG: N-acetyltransferase [Thermomicrobiales bacterium]|nr:N-acetyltransferase [Thermomicrobiales bacterium]
MTRPLHFDVRSAKESDYPAIRRLLDDAFGGSDESRLVEAIRHDESFICELVATDAGIAGQVMFSELDLVIDHQSVKTASLAPLAVLPARQRQGVGLKLVRAGLEHVAASGYEAVIVVGDPDYHRRFGFSPDLATRLRSPYQGEACQALELVPGMLKGEDGEIVYPSPFRIFEE